MRPSQRLRIHRDAVAAIIAQYPLRRPCVFGSAARGDDVEGSDLDILVEPDPGLTFYDLAELERRLSDLLGCGVDVLTPGGLARDVLGRIGPDLAPL